MSVLKSFCIRSKTKYIDYKNKLKSANSNIQTLVARLAKFEYERQAERENQYSARDEFEDRGVNPVKQQIHQLQNDHELNAEIQQLLKEQNIWYY